jgi:lipoprotein signal peptidase
VIPLVRTIVAVVAADQATKAAAQALGPYPPGFMEQVRNEALSLNVADAGRWTEVILMAAGLFAAAVFVGRRLRQGRLAPWMAGLMLGGAASNLVDRAVLGSVRDFLAIGPVVINLADVAIVGALAAAALAAQRPPGRPAGAQPEVARPGYPPEARTSATTSSSGDASACV